mgnify:CR=1 FL=1
MNAKIWRIIPFLIFLILVLFLWKSLSLDPQHLPSVQVGKSLPAFNLKILGKKEGQLTPGMMRGHIVLLNVWASWCDACTEEQAFLMHLAQEGFVIYGLNYKDTQAHAKRWLTEWGNPYKLVGQDNSGRAAIDLGVYGAPETFLIDADGVIRYRHAGALNQQIWEKAFMPIIQQLEHRLDA